MPTNLTIATPSDTETILALIETFYQSVELAFDTPTMRQGLSTLLANPTIGFVTLARVDDIPAAYIIATFGFDLEFGGRQATLTDVFVAPPYRRNGLASAALAFTEAECRRRGVNAIELQVIAGNNAARALYTKAGFDLPGRFVMVKTLDD